MECFWVSSESCLVKSEKRRGPRTDPVERRTEGEFLLSKTVLQQPVGICMTNMT